MTQKAPVVESCPRIPSVVSQKVLVGKLLPSLQEQILPLSLLCCASAEQNFPGMKQRQSLPDLPTLLTTTGGANI